MGAGGSGDAEGVAGERDMVFEEETGGGGGGAEEYDGSQVAEGDGEE